jgi:hypothetical protein
LFLDIDTFCRLFVVGWKHSIGGKDYCHIVLFFKVNMFELHPCHYYEGLSHIIISWNPKKSKFVKETTFFNFMLWCNVKARLHQKNVCCNIILKMQNYILKWLKWFLVFWKFVISTKHCDSIWLEYVCELCEEFDN